MSCKDTHVNTWRFLVNQDFYWFLFNHTEGRTAQTALPSWCFRAGHCPCPEELQRDGRVRKNRARTELWAKLVNLHSTEMLLLSHRHWSWHCLCSSFSPGNSHPKLLSIPLFCGISENLSSQMGPKGYNRSSFPTTAKLSKHCTSFHSLLNFCNCHPTWLLLSLLHSNYSSTTPR